MSHQVKFQQITQIPRSSPTQSANYAKFAHFVNLFYIMFQAPAPAENPGKFQRITQIPRSSRHTVRELRKIRTFLLTYSILCFRHLPRQRTLENSSELRRFRTIRPHSPRITRIPHTSHYN